MPFNKKIHGVQVLQVNRGQVGSMFPGELFIFCPRLVQQGQKVEVLLLAVDHTRATNAITQRKAAPWAGKGQNGSKPII